MSIYKRAATHAAELNHLKKAINYILDPEKTDAALIQSRGVSVENAFEDMVFLKQLYCKTDGRQYLHWILSHNKGVPLKTVEAVSRDILKLVGAEFQVIAAIHTNTNNLHTHFIINSVRITDGKKFSQSKRDMLKFRQVVNQILDSYGLDAIGKTEDFAMQEGIGEEEIPIKGAANIYQSGNVIWTEGTKPFVVDSDFLVEERKKGEIRPFTKEESEPELTKPFTIDEKAQKPIKPFVMIEEPKQKLVKPFTIGKSKQKLEKPFTMEEPKPELTKPFTLKDQKQKLIKPFSLET